MKQGHLALMFLLIFTACWSVLFVEQQRYDLAINEKQRVERALAGAIENTANVFAEVIHASEKEKQQTLEQAFIDSFYIAMGIVDEEKRRELRMYLPLLALVEEDGICFCYMQEQEKEGIAELASVWSEKIFFPHSEGSSESEKKRILVETLEKESSEIITNYNYIATQYGLSYSFSVPRFLENGEKELNFPMLFVVFQGWPLNSAGNILYENCLDAGLYMKRTRYYSVSKPKDILSPYCVYHISEGSCEAKTNILAEFIREEDAIRQYGALPCEICLP